MPGGFKTMRGLLQSEKALERAQQKKEAHKVELAEKAAAGKVGQYDNASQIDLTEYLEVVEKAARLRKQILSELRTRVDKFIDSICRFEEAKDCKLLDYSNKGMGVFNQEADPSLVALFDGIDKEELVQILRKVRQGYTGDLSDKRVVKIMRAWPSEERLLKFFEEYRLEGKTF